MVEVLFLIALYVLAALTSVKVSTVFNNAHVALTFTQAVRAVAEVLNYVYSLFWRFTMINMIISWLVAVITSILTHRTTVGTLWGERYLSALLYFTRRGWRASSRNGAIHTALVLLGYGAMGGTDEAFEADPYYESKAFHLGLDCAIPAMKNALPADQVGLFIHGNTIVVLGHGGMHEGKHLMGAYLGYTTGLTTAIYNPNDVAIEGYTGVMPHVDTVVFLRTIKALNPTYTVKLITCAMGDSPEVVAEGCNLIEGKGAVYISSYNRGDGLNVRNSYEEGYTKMEGNAMIQLKGRSRTDILRDIINAGTDLYVVPVQDKKVSIQVSEAVSTHGRMITEAALSATPDKSIRYTHYRKVFGVKIYNAIEMIGVPVDGFKGMMKAMGYTYDFGCHSQIFLDEGNGTVYLCQGTLHALDLMFCISKKAKVNMTDKAAVLAATEEDFMWHKPTTLNKMLKYSRREIGGSVFAAFEAADLHYATGDADQRYSVEVTAQVPVEDEITIHKLSTDGVHATCFSDGESSILTTEGIGKAMVDASGNTDKAAGGVIGTAVGAHGWMVKSGTHTYALKSMVKNVLYTTADNLKMKTIFSYVTVIRNTAASWKNGALSGQVLNCADKFLAILQLDGKKVEALAAKKALVEVINSMTTADIKATKDGLTDLTKLEGAEHTEDLAVVTLLKRIVSGLKAIGGDVETLHQLDLVKELKQSAIIGGCNKYEGVNVGQRDGRSGSLRMDKLGFVTKGQAMADLKSAKLEEGWYLMYRSPASSEGSLIAIYITQMPEEMKVAMGGRYKGVMILGAGIKELYEVVAKEKGMNHADVANAFFIEEEWTKVYNTHTLMLEAKKYAKTMQIRLGGADYDNDSVIFISMNGHADNNQIDAISNVFGTHIDFKGKDFESYLDKAEYVLSNEGINQYFADMHSGKYGEPGVGKYALMAALTVIFYSRNRRVLKALYRRYTQWQKIMSVLPGGKEHMLPTLVDVLAKVNTERAENGFEAITNDEHLEYMSKCFFLFLMEAALAADVFLQAAVDKAAPDPELGFGKFIPWLEALLFGRWPVMVGETVMRSFIHLGDKAVDGRSFAHHAMVMRGTGPMTKDYKALMGAIEALEGRPAVDVWQNYDFDISGAEIITVKGTPVISIPAPSKEFAASWWQMFRGVMCYEKKALNRGISYQTKDGKDRYTEVVYGIDDMFFKVKGALYGRGELIASAAYMHARNLIANTDDGLMRELPKYSSTGTPEARTLPVVGKSDLTKKTHDKVGTSALAMPITKLLMVLHDVIPFVKRTDAEIKALKHDDLIRQARAQNEILAAYPHFAGLVPNTVFIKQLKKDKADKHLDDYTMSAMRKAHKTAWFKVIDAEIARYNRAGYNGLQIVGQTCIAFLEGARVRETTYAFGGCRMVETDDVGYKYTALVQGIVLPYISTYLATIDQDNNDVEIKLHVHKNDAAAINGQTVKVRVFRNERTGKIADREVKAVLNDGSIIRLFRRVTEDGTTVNLLRIFGLKTLQTHREAEYTVMVTPETEATRDGKNNMLATLTRSGYVDLAEAEKIRLELEGIKVAATAQQKAIEELDMQMAERLASMVDLLPDQDSCTTEYADGVLPETNEVVIEKVEETPDNDDDDPTPTAPTRLRTIIAGSRDITAYEHVDMAVMESGFEEQIICVVSGCAAGVDTLGEKYAEKHNLPVAKYPADWNKYGKSAGYKRNEQMADNADALIAVWDGISRGTKHMIDTAKAKGLKVFVYHVEIDEPTEPENKPTQPVIEEKAANAIAADPMANFKPNEGQQKLVAELLLALKTGKKTFTIQGKAGTGKTTCIYYALRKAVECGLIGSMDHVGFSATSWKAATRLEMGINALGGRFSVLSVDTMFGIGLAGKISGYVRNFIKKLDSKTPCAEYGIHVLDEVSMLGDFKYDAVMRYNECRLFIFIGDKDQIPPVGANGKISKAITHADIELTKVERQVGDNTIPGIADKIITRLKNKDFSRLEWSSVKRLMGLDGGIKLINKEDVVKTAIDNDCHILCYKNKSVAAYNADVRKAKGYKDMLVIGENLMGYENVGGSPDKNPDVDPPVINGVEYKVTHLGGLKTTDGIEYMSFRATDEFGRPFIGALVTEDGRIALTNALRDIFSEIVKLETEDRNGNRKEIADLEAMMDNLAGTYLFMSDIALGNRYVWSSRDRAFVLKEHKFDANIKYGYACTIHKAQGCTWQNVVFDHNDIPSFVMGTSEYLNLSNVAITRSRKITYICE